MLILLLSFYLSSLPPSLSLYVLFYRLNYHQHGFTCTLSFGKSFMKEKKTMRKTHFNVPFHDVMNAQSNIIEEIMVVLSSMYQSIVFDQFSLTFAHITYIQIWYDSVSFEMNCVSYNFLSRTWNGCAFCKDIKLLLLNLFCVNSSCACDMLISMY